MFKVSSSKTGSELKGLGDCNCNGILRVDHTIGPLNKEPQGILLLVAESLAPMGLQERSLGTPHAHALDTAALLPIKSMLSSSNEALMVHVPLRHRLWPQSTYIGITLRPMYILYNMEPIGVGFPS